MGRNTFGEMCMLPRRLMLGARRTQGSEMPDAMCPRFLVKRERTCAQDYKKLNM